MLAAFPKTICQSHCESSESVASRLWGDFRLRSPDE